MVSNDVGPVYVDTWARDMLDMEDGVGSGNEPLSRTTWNSRRAFVEECPMSIQVQKPQTGAMK